jgi:hypothetical protein
MSESAFYNLNRPLINDNGTIRHPTPGELIRTLSINANQVATVTKIPYAPKSRPETNHYYAWEKTNYVMLRQQTAQWTDSVCPTIWLTYNNDLSYWMRRPEALLYQLAHIIYHYGTQNTPPGVITLDPLLELEWIIQNPEHPYVKGLNHDPIRSKSH